MRERKSRRHQDRLDNPDHMLSKGHVSAPTILHQPTHSTRWYWKRRLQCLAHRRTCRYYHQGLRSVNWRKETKEGKDAISEPIKGFSCTKIWTLGKPVLPKVGKTWYALGYKTVIYSRNRVCVWVACKAMEMSNFSDSLGIYDCLLWDVRGMKSTSDLKIEAWPIRTTRDATRYLCNKRSCRWVMTMKPVAKRFQARQRALSLIERDKKNLVGCRNLLNRVRILASIMWRVAKLAVHQAAALTQVWTVTHAT